MSKQIPKAIFDNIGYLENPFKINSFDLPEFIKDLSLCDDCELDYEYSWKFIYSYNGSSATFNVYRREVERLLQWSWLIESRSIMNLRREDIESYILFCMEPPNHWIGTKNVARFKSKAGLRKFNKEWKPFVSSVSKSESKLGMSASIKNFTLSQTSIKSIFSVLSSFYNFLIQENICQANPVMMIRQKSKFIVKNSQKAPVRRISNLQWDYIVETVELMAADNPQTHERTFFVLNCLFSMYLRISELVADERSLPTMGDFRKDNDNNWWLHVIGKGNKSRIITVSDQMLERLKRYRLHLGLSQLPSIGDRIPLVPKLIGNGPVTSTRQIRSLLQKCFDNAYERMKHHGLSEDAEDLKVATVHWLRHTGISEDVKLRPREHVRDDAGHASMQTTDRYIESDTRERHASGRNKSIKEL